MSTLVIDAGPTGVTAALVPSSGGVATSAHVDVALHPAAHGWSEQATDDLWRAVLGASREALSAGGGDRPGRVVVSTDPVATVLWDRETLGSPRRVALAPPTDVLPWVATHEPHTWALLLEGSYAVGGLESYLVARLTLGTWHVTDPTHAAATGLLRPDGAGWSAEACRSAGIPQDALPELVPTAVRGFTTEARALHGLALPVTVVAHDPAAGPDERLRAAAAAALRAS